MSKWWRSLRTAVAQPYRHDHHHRSLHYHTIQATPREFTGRRVSSRDRDQGRIPAVVFSQEILSKSNGPSSSSSSSSHRPASRKQLLTTETKQIRSLLKSVELPFFLSTKFKLQVRAGSGSSLLLDTGYVLPIKVHRDEETGRVLNLVFVWAEDGTRLKVDVPVVFTGVEDCPGIKKGGSLNKIRTSLKFLCPAEHIPQKIEVDVSKLDIEDKISMHDIEFHPSMELLSKNENMPVCKIVGMNLENQEPSSL